MHVGGIKLDLNWFLQFLFTVFIIALGLLYLVKNTASKYFEVDGNFEGGGRGGGSRGGCDRNQVMPESPMETEDLSCANCGKFGTKRCSGCKSVRYCSSTCQAAHWKSGHKSKCNDIAQTSSTQTARTNFGFKLSTTGSLASSGIALIPASGSGNSKVIKKPKKVLFSYDEFVELYNWDKSGFPPCGLLNCGNSCFANVVLQCLTYTRPLLAYLLEKGHQRDCRRNDWCFLCVFQSHVERASQSLHPFSPINILSRLPNIGGNLGYGRQEDAHEFMRFAIDTMQSVCLDEFGGEKVVNPASQETTLIQHIFGGHLQSQVMCTKCNKISNQVENMMDLTVEIHGDAASLEECLNQFTAKEWLHGENMYKCEGCNDYVKAWKRLTIQRAPNILTIALKRFQSGRFGKLNKRVSFSEILDLGPYMVEEGDGTNVYKLYAVVVHVDMLNASYFGHYICYTKDFQGNWYRIDDCKVERAELEEVLSQGAYMLLYSRVSVRPSCLLMAKSSEQRPIVKIEPDSCMNGSVLLTSGSESMNSISTKRFVVSKNNSEDAISKSFEDNGIVHSKLRMSVVSKDVSSCKTVPTSVFDSEGVRDAEDKYNPELHSSAMKEICRREKDEPVEFCSGTVGEDPQNMMEVSSCVKESSAAIDSKAARMEDLGNRDMFNCESKHAAMKDVTAANEGLYSFSNGLSSSKSHNLKRESTFRGLDDDENSSKRVEITESC